MFNLQSGLLFLLSHMRILQKIYNINSRSKREHDSEDTEDDAVIKDSTKANLAYFSVILIFQLRLKHSGCIMFSSFD